MRIFSLILSAVTLVITLFYLVTQFPSLNSLSGIIYFTLMVILILICVTGMVINIPMFTRFHKKLKRN